MLKVQNGDAKNVLNTSECPEDDEDLKMHEQRRKPNFLFSVDYILNKAGDVNSEDCNNEKQDGQNFDWLYCTRFKPPKLDRKLICIIF